MMLTTWNGLKEKISSFDRALDNIINEKINGILEEGGFADRAITAAIDSILQFPINVIAATAYSNFSAGSFEQDGVFEKKGYPETLRTSGEDRYNKTSYHLNSINVEIRSSRTVAKQSTVRLLMS